MNIRIKFARSRVRTWDSFSHLVLLEAPSNTQSIINIAKYGHQSRIKMLKLRSGQDFSKAAVMLEHLID